MNSLCYASATYSFDKLHGQLSWDTCHPRSLYMLLTRVANNSCLTCSEAWQNAELQCCARASCKLGLLCLHGCSVLSCFSCFQPPTPAGKDAAGKGKLEPQLVIIEARQQQTEFPVPILYIAVVLPLSCQASPAKGHSSCDGLTMQFHESMLTAGCMSL